MTSEALAILGLSANMLATVVVFFFGFPQPNLEEGVNLGIDDNTVLQDGTSVRSINARTRRRRRLYRFMSSLGLALMFAGFLLQLLSILHGNNPAPTQGAAIRCVAPTCQIASHH